MREGSDEVISKGRCPDCGSKDNLVTYRDGHQFCYTPGCGLKQSSKGDMSETTQPKPKGDYIAYHEQNIVKGIPSRNIKKDVLKAAGYFIHKKGGRVLHIAPYYSQGGELVYQKYRTEDKEFFFEPVSDTQPQPKACQLFMQNVWGDRFDRKVVVTEGELDALSVAQATSMKIAVVSIPAGVGSAADSLKANYRWLDRFEEIILWMDNDEPGQAVVEECAKLFEVGKVKTVRVPGFKDASEMLQAGKEGECYQAVWGAVKWAPRGIVNAADCQDDMDEPEAVAICPYPFPRLQEMTLGRRRAEVTYHVAGTGVGKTSILNEYQADALANKVKIGVMRFEDTRRKAQLDIMGIKSNRRLHIDGGSKEFRRELHAQTFGSGLVELFDPEQAEWTFDAIMSYARYMVMGLGCLELYIDPLSFIVAAVNEKDERKALDHVSFGFARFVKQTGAHLHISHHLNRGEGRAFEEGGEISLKNIRGSAGVANFSMSVFGYERNQQGERPDLTRIRILKNRFTGNTGIADTLKWDEVRGRQEPTDEPYPEDKNEKAGFGPVPSEY